MYYREDILTKAIVGKVYKASCDKSVSTKIVSAILRLTGAYLCTAAIHSEIQEI